MEFQPSWTFPTPDSMYTLTQSQPQSQSPFSSNVSSYFRRPTKVVKPSSRNTSPKHLGRRRTATTNVPVGRTRSVIDKQRSNMQHPVVNRQPSRPMSWHPNAYSDFNFADSSSYFNNVNTMYEQPSFYSTATVNGLVTPLSQPIMDEPQIQELITPLEGLTAAEMGQPCDGDMYGYQYWTNQDLAKQYPVMDNMFPQSMLQQPWHCYAQDLPTAPSSPSFLPIQGAIEASPLDLNTRSLPQKATGDELVAMGLYDSPAEVQSSSLLFGGSGWKRSLKLEESFEPPAENEQDQKENEDEDSDGELDEEAPVENATEEPTPFPDYVDQPVPFPATNLTGQSFFFEAEPTDVSQHQAVCPPATGSFNGGLMNQGMSYGWF